MTTDVTDKKWLT